MGLSPLTSSLQVDCTRLHVDFERYRLVSTVVRLPALCVIDQPYLRGYKLPFAALTVEDFFS
jgi:hypothetical protein